ncbi:MAG: transcription antitermination factor NusB [Clostridia bacterium]|nr:transcription antitermination factor NusB [Clostridia bacterium]
MSRRTIRENVFKLVYETGVCGAVNDITVEMVTQNIDQADKVYFDEVFYGIVSKKGELEEVIKRYAHSYQFDRLYKVDIAILLVAIYEIFYVIDIPYKVSANEAVELAKAYSTEKSASYINGILSSVIKNMEENK